MIFAIHDVAGRSRLTTVNVSLGPAMTEGWPGLMAATQWGMSEGPAGASSDWHRSKQPGLTVVIGGAWEIEAGDGQRRELGVGDVMLLLDTRGQGHRSRVTSSVPCRAIGIAYPDEVAEALERFVLGRREEK